MRGKTLLLSMALALLLLPGAALAQSGGGYEITSWTVDGGGGSSSGATYALVGTVGQPDAGPAMMGGSYRLVGGFWAGAATPIMNYDVYLPLTLRSP
jgi:hypothetical protein